MLLSPLQSLSPGDPKSKLPAAQARKMEFSQAKREPRSTLSNSSSPEVTKCELSHKSHPQVRFRSLSRNPGGPRRAAGGRSYLWTRPLVDLTNHRASGKRLLEPEESNSSIYLPPPKPQFRFAPPLLVRLEGGSQGRALTLSRLIGRDQLPHTLRNLSWSAPCCQLITLQILSLLCHFPKHTQRHSLRPALEWGDPGGSQDYISQEAAREQHSLTSYYGCGSPQAPRHTKMLRQMDAWLTDIYLTAKPDHMSSIPGFEISKYYGSQSRCVRLPPHGTPRRH